MLPCWHQWEQTNWKSFLTSKEENQNLSHDLAARALQFNVFASSSDCLVVLFDVVFILSFFLSSLQQSFTNHCYHGSIFLNTLEIMPSCSMNSEKIAESFWTLNNDQFIYSTQLMQNFRLRSQRPPTFWPTPRKQARLVSTDLNHTGSGNENAALHNIPRENFGQWGLMVQVVLTLYSFLSRY